MVKRRSHGRFFAAAAVGVSLTVATILFSKDSAVNILVVAVLVVGLSTLIGIHYFPRETSGSSQTNASED